VRGDQASLGEERRQQASDFTVGRRIALTEVSPRTMAKIVAVSSTFGWC
jgi:hypothetical protein